ncbi:restriction endonuclease [Halobacillus litoralis]|uniref:restriction endonuclease n=1 Tax=Halobacillus litoralis TaxID=45668 RepID=UPI001CD40175|nr:restriction endonuclease [Halobacillus litoralis]MCA0971352.1 restriction endonuclease [Halobacillus litoralis]
MTKKTRRQRQGEVQTAVAGLVVMAGMWFMFEFDVTSIYYIFGLLIVAALAGGIASTFVPDMRRKENKGKNEYTGLPDRKRKASSLKAAVSKKGKSNLLRSEKEIMTLPLEELSWREFEELCYLYYKAKGYQPRRTSEGADGGVDLIIFDPEHNTDVAVQIKHYKKGKQVDVKLIRELDSAKKNHGCALGDMITSSGFTNPALVEADDRKIGCKGSGWVRMRVLAWREMVIKAQNQQFYS